MSTPEVYLREEHKPVKLIKHVLQPRYGMSVFDGDFIDGLTIHTHPNRSILLRHKKAKNDARAKALIAQALRNELLHLPLNLHGIFGIHCISELV